MCVICLSSCPEGWVQASQKAKCACVFAKVWAWVWMLMCFCKGKEKNLCMCACGVGGKSTQASAKSFWFTGTSRMWKNRINNAPLRSSNTHTHTHTQPSFQHWFAPRHIHTHTYVYPCMQTPLCAHKHKFQSVGKQITTNKNSMIQIWAPLSFCAKHYRRLPSVSHDIVLSLSSFLFLAHLVQCF